VSAKLRVRLRYWTESPDPGMQCHPAPFGQHRPHEDLFTWKNVVYEAYPEEGAKPFYVGLTGNIKNRWENHLRITSWAPQTSLLVLTYLPCVEQMRRFEFGRIRTLRPVHNRQHNPDWEARMKARKLKAVAS
jgi:hypothetical protein